MFKSVILTMALVAGLLPLQAQVDTKLRTSTDLLDVYKTTPGKPEVLTVFDFSNSMYAMYWHKDYYVNVTGTNHVGSNGWFNETPDGDNSQYMAPLLDSSGKVYIAQGWGINGYIPTKSGGSFYWPQRMDNSGTGRLVKPNGDLVTISGTYSQAGLTDLVKQASHIRMTATYGSVTRTVDLPIPWAIFTSASGSSPTILTIPDTIGGGPDIIPDEAYQSVNPNNIVNDRQYDNSTGKYYYKIGLLHYNPDYLWWIFFGKDKRNTTGTGSDATSDYIVPAGAAGTVPWTNGLPGMTRTQALKYAVVSTWLRNQKKVWWGFRYLDGNEQNKTTVSADNGNASSTTVSRDIRLFRTAQNSSTADPKLKQFVQTVPSTGTPLTYAFANAYTQLSLNKDASSTFGTSNNAGGQSGTENPIPACRNSFMVAFTDGVANDTISGHTAIGTGSDVYAQGNAAVGNTLLGSLSTALTPGSSNRFNIWTLASVAAHFNSGSYVSPTGTGSISISAAAPFLISDRGATISNKRRIRTMTVGMSLYGNLSDAAGGKSSMYRAALYGNPSVTSWTNPTSADPTPPFDPNIPTQADRTINPFFFDAQNVDQLAAAMDAIIDEAVAASGSVSAPSAPLVGLSLGREAFLGLFEPAKKGPLWKGDLLAAGIKLNTSSDTFLSNTGESITSVNSENAIWSAGDLLQSEGYTYNFEAYQYTDPTKITGTGPRSWKLGKRKVITNISVNTLIDLDESTITSPSTVGAGTDDAARIAILRFLRGAHATAETGTASSAPSINRTTIMGDIISSSPAVLEYPLTSALLNNSPVLSSVDTTDWHETHFRVIFVADNQGYFHAFGELAGVKYIMDTSDPPKLSEKRPIAAVDELWAFYPGELLNSLPKYIKDSSNTTHVYGIDGSSVIYFNDKPGTDEVVGNGLVDGSDDVRVIVGLGKGGRNYYAFNMLDPFAPELVWKLVPDTSTNTIVKHMGLATSTPALARVEIGGTTKDVLFIGGGMSTKSVDAAMGATLGRNLLVINTLTGAIEKTWDFSGITNMGCLPASVVPVEFLANTGRAQRVYFIDQPFEGNSLGTGARGSAVWALGRTSLASNGVTRLDSSNLDTWTGGSYSAGGLRKVYQGSAGLVLSTSPVPFRLGSAYPIYRTATPILRPAAMGLAFNAGDRNDPLDRDLINPSNQNQLTVLFDRQDSASLTGNTPAPANASSLDMNGLTDADLMDLTAVSTETDTKLNSLSNSYYLKTKFGYKLLLGSSSSKLVTDSGGANFYPKATSSPTVLDGVLFFSVFVPGIVTDPNISTEQAACSGTGQTNIYRIGNVLAPIFSSGTTTADLTKTDTSVASYSGRVVSFANIPGPLAGLGSVGILVSGQGKTSTGTAGSIATAGTEAEIIKGKVQNLKFRLKTWRIVR